MIQDIIAEITNNSAKFRELKQRINSGRFLCLNGLTGSARRFFVSYLAASIDRPIMIVTPDITSALKYTSELQNQTSSEIAYIPSAETSPYELVCSDSSLYKEQLKILQSFREGYVKAVTVSAKTLLNASFHFNDFEEQSIQLEVKAVIDPYKIAQKLIDIGYTRVSNVMDPENFA